MNVGTLVLVCILAAAPLAGQFESLSDGPYRIEITLERKSAGVWNAVEPRLVLRQDDRVRFRFHANFDGYLYIENRGTSGSSTLLFPARETGRENRIESGKEYTVPDGGDSFRITGPAGHDVTYWLVNPTDLRAGASDLRPAAPALGSGLGAAPKLTPRCNDGIFRARGVCVDSSAGLKKQPELPESAAARPLTGPIIYEFHLSHR
ncbi:MAG: DUF4384 domain-containing protein [Acidobacteriota bacterium]|nr:DUF4384 domain-containing protein [Acidobacteriota bacterium]